MDFVLRPGDAISIVWWRISTASGLDVDRRKNIFSDEATYIDANLENKSLLSSAQSIP